MSASVEFTQSRVTLEFLKVAAQRHLSPSMAALTELKLMDIYYSLTESMALELSTRVQAVKTDTQRYDKTVQVLYTGFPASWWQMFKRDVLRYDSLPGWIQKLLRPVRTEDRTKSVNVHFDFDLYSSYPESEYAVMPREFGKPYPLAMLRRDPIEPIY